MARRYSAKVWAQTRDSDLEGEGGIGENRVVLQSGRADHEHSWRLLVAILLPTTLRIFPQVIPLSPVVYPLNTLEYHVSLGSANALTPEVLQAITGFRCAARRL